MAYMLLVVEPAGQRQALPEPQGRERYAQMLEFSAGLQRRGLLVQAQALKSDSTGARVTARDGHVAVVDGPFAEAKEMVGGFFLLACDSFAQAVRIAQECPARDWATLEVRELGPCFL